MKRSGLRDLGSTQQKLLRQLLLAPQGASVEALCNGLGVTHNAVRQHLTALCTAGHVVRGAVQPTGGRPQARFLLTPQGRDLFPRRYGLITTALLEQLYARQGPAEVQSLLTEMGRSMGAAAATRIATEEPDDVARALAEQLDALGYEAMAVRHGNEMQVEAHNCVFHDVAAAHADVCRFDVAFMEAATDRPIEHLECLVRGGRCCRFRIVPRDAKLRDSE
ncbi:MAG: hypothetical protein ABI411_12815 [Tahibacter sp.]